MKLLKEKSIKYAFIITLVLLFGMILLNESGVTNEYDQQISSSETESGLRPQIIPVASVAPVISGSSQNSIVNKQGVEADPIVTCQFPHSGPINMSESKCQQMTDCEVEPGKWQAVWLTDCNALYAKNGETLVATDVAVKDNLIDCVFNDSWGESHISPQVTEDYCKRLVALWDKHNSASTSSYEYEPSKTVACKLSYGTFQLTETYCNTVSIADNYNQFAAKEIYLKSLPTISLPKIKTSYGCLKRDDFTDQCVEYGACSSGADSFGNCSKW